jgi:shikimate dehydrogenase
VCLLNENTSSQSVYHSWLDEYSIDAKTDIVINATSIGLYPNVDQQLNINFDTLKRNMVVADGIHNPAQTHLLKKAKSKGCKTVNGIQMLVNQGVIGIKYWSGIDVDPTVMHAVLKEVLEIEE